MNRLFVILASLSLAAALHAFAIEPGKDYYDLPGYLVIRSEAAGQRIFLTQSPNGGEEIPLKDGTYPRSVLSIAREYGSDKRVLLSGVGNANHELEVSLSAPEFVPYVPKPQHVKSVKLDGDTLTIVASINRCIKREKLLLRFGPVMLTAPVMSSIWIEVPDLHLPVCGGDEVEHTFTVDLMKHYGKYAPWGARLRIPSGVCESHNVEWRIPR